MAVDPGGNVRYSPPSPSLRTRPVQPAPPRGVGTQPPAQPLPTRGSGQADLYNRGYQPPRYQPPNTGEGRYTTNPVSVAARGQPVQQRPAAPQQGYGGPAAATQGLPQLEGQYDPNDFIWGAQDYGGGGGWGGGGGGGGIQPWQPTAEQSNRGWEQDYMVGGLPLRNFNEIQLPMSAEQLAAARFQNQINPARWALEQEQARFGMGLQGREMTLNELLGQSTIADRLAQQQLAQQQFGLASRGQEFAQGLQTRQQGFAEQMQTSNLELQRAAQQLNQMVQSRQIGIAEANQALNELRNRQQFGLQGRQQGEAERAALVREAQAGRGLDISEKGLQEQIAARLAANQLAERGQNLGAFRRTIGANLGAV